MATLDMNGSSSLSFNYINETIFTGMKAQEDKLKTTLAGLGATGDGNLNPTQLLQVQQQVQQWTMMTEIQSTMAKQLADSMKGIIQKSG
ncbi:EscF/YscF/HrpA family type III secretion system needle major subunit [Achromobacter marplatensis]|uniref:EscF/YscF/HrpA family type III secretion system needle major subunit n=1 Tax=Achromobacter marplatensis TaxID=470868 RepID=UPI0039F6B378